MFFVYDDCRCCLFALPLGPGYDDLLFLPCKVLTGSPWTATIPAARRILFLVNPKAGTGRADKVFKEVEIMVSRANIKYDVLQTTHQGHAADQVQELELEQYDSLVVVSGDGLVNEALNGMMRRWDWEEAIKKLSIGHIPAGTGNGLSKSITSISGEVADTTGERVEAPAIFRPVAHGSLFV